MTNERPPIRWRLWAVPALAILAVAALAVIWAWSSAAPSRQDRVVRTMLIVGPALLVELGWFGIWVLFLSRMRPAMRAAACAALAVVLAGAAYSLRFEGFTGDVRPRMGWRWQRLPGELPAPRVAPAESTPLEAAPAHDHPQFLGAQRDGTVRGVKLADDWSDRPPQRLWRQPIGAGWSGFAVVGGRAVTLEQRAGDELVSCYDAASGTLLWFDAEPLRFEEPMGGSGPRSTPTIDGGRVYAVGGTGLLRALDLLRGERLWSVDLARDAGSGLPQYGVSSSPLVADGRVWATAGAGGTTLLAYDASTGALQWAAGDDQPGDAYSSPLAATLGGVPQILLLNGSFLAGHDPATGVLLWHAPWPGDTQRASQPVVLPGDRVYVSTGYGIGGKMFHVSRDASGTWGAETLWESKSLKAKFTDVVHRDGYLYGLDDGILACIDVETGRRLWKGGRYGHGQTLLVGERLLVLAENGEVALVEASPEAYRELGRFQAIEGKTWGHPALAGAQLLVRNDREAACYELPLAE